MTSALSAPDPDFDQLAILDALEDLAAGNISTEEYGRLAALHEAKYPRKEYVDTRAPWDRMGIAVGLPLPLRKLVWRNMMRSSAKF